MFPFEREKYSTKVLKSVIECLTSSNIIIYNEGSDWILNLKRDWEAFDSFKMVFSAQKGVAQPCSWLPFGVGYYVCLGPTGDANVASPAVFWPRYRHSKFWIHFLIWNRPNYKMNKKKQKKAWNTYQIIIFQQK